MMSIEEHDGIVVACVTGEIDMANTATIEHGLAAHVTSEHRGFVVDLSNVTYLDSAGIRLLYQLDERASGRQQQAVIVIPSNAAINRTLEAAGAFGSLKIVPTADEAVELLSA